MPDKDKSAVATVPAPAVVPPAPGTPPVPPRRSPGHRGADVKDTVAEMAAKAHEISLEAGSKMAAAMKDVVGAAAGLTGLVVESARDLLQYMVRRGQMTQDEADKLMREVEASHGLKRKAPTPFPAPGTKSVPKVAEAPRAVEATRPVVAAARPSPVAVREHSKPAARHTPARKPAAKKTTMKPAAKKHSAKSATKSKGKASAKSAKRR